jgi:glycosyltransferase involved in cell wall biosynthesis
MERKEPLISIVCDTYNHAPYVKRALDSFLSQETEFSFEIIVHDDASTDGTADIIRSYEAAHPALFRCVYRTENVFSKDPKILEHYVFPLARGKYIAICEGDDYWTSPLKLQKQISYMEAHPECTLCVCAADLVDPEEHKTGSVAPYDMDTDISTEDVIIGGGGFVATASIVAPTHLAQNRGSFCDETDVDDAVLQIWFAANGTTHYFAESMCAYRQAVPGSWTETYHAAGREAQITHHRGLARALREFDRQSNYRWHDAVDFNATYQEYEVLRMTNDLPRLKKRRIESVIWSCRSSGVFVCISYGLEY